MTDTTIDEHTGDGGVDVGASATDLFGELADDTADEPAGEQGSTTAAGSDAETGTETDTDTETTNSNSNSSGPTGTTDDAPAEPRDIEDQTAASIFGQLKGDDGAAVDDVLDDSPEAIIASADEPVDEPTDLDDDLLADDGELEALLLTGRTKEQEFLWVDTETESESESEVEAEAEADSQTEPDPGSAPEPTLDSPASDRRSEPDGSQTDDTAKQQGRDDYDSAHERASDSNAATHVPFDATSSASEPEPEAESAQDAVAADNESDGVLSRLRSTLTDLL